MSSLTQHAVVEDGEPDACGPIGIVAMTFALAGSIRSSVFAFRSATQIEPNPALRSHSAGPTSSIVAVTFMVAGSTASTAPLPRSATQIRPSAPTAMPHGPMPTIACWTTVFVAGSIRSSAPLELLVTQAELASAAIAHGAAETLIVAMRLSPRATPVGTGTGVARGFRRRSRPARPPYPRPTPGRCCASRHGAWLASTARQRPASG